MMKPTPGLILLFYFMFKCTFPLNVNMASFDHAELLEKNFVFKKHKPTDKPTCPIIPKFSAGAWRTFKHASKMEYYTSVEDSMQIAPEQDQVTQFLKDLEKNNFLQYSAWSPTSCQAVHNVTLILSYKKRILQLRKFITHMHPFLQRQQVSYRIVVVEQVNNAKFNRAKLFNVGFKEGFKRWPTHCYIFHDVDLLPENLENIYGCTKSPRHLSSSINSWRYLLSYGRVFGGVVSMTGEQFQKVNGFSNLYTGWGGEDDDFYRRVRNRSLEIIRFDSVISSYWMIPHAKEPTGHNGKFLREVENRFASDGLNSLNYTLISIQDGLGFTHIRAKV